MQPPQNPYGAPDPYGQPNPYGAPNRGVSMDVIGEAWKMVQANIGPWIGAAAIYLGVAIVLNGLQSVLQRPINTSAMPNGMPAGMPAYMMRENTPASLLASLAGFIITSLLIAGIMNMAINAVRTGKADLSKMFDVGQFAVPAVLGNLLVGIITGVGALCCLIPGIIASIGLVMVMPLIVGSRRGVIEAITESWAAMSPHLLPGFLLILVLGLVNVAGVCALGIGLLITIPISAISIAIVYRDLFGGGATPQNPNFPNAPLADPRA